MIEVGDKVRRVHHGFQNIEVGDVGTVEKVTQYTIILKEFRCGFSKKHFEPADKYAKHKHKLKV